MLKYPLKVIIVLFIVVVLFSFASSSYAKVTQSNVNKNEPWSIEKADPLDKIDCSKMVAMGIEKQENFRAGRIRVHCGLESAPVKLNLPVDLPVFGIIRPEAIGGVDVDVITGTTDTYATVTQSEAAVWGNGNTIFVANNSSPSANCAGGSYGHGSYSTDGGATFTRLCPNPFATGHTQNYGDPMVVYNTRLSKWYSAWLATGCGGQGIGVWESTNAINWTVGACAHSGGSDDRESMWVDNNSGSPYWGRMYISWNDFAVASGELAVVYSDNGTTWTEVVLYNGATFHRDVQVTGSPGTDGTVFVASMDEVGGGCGTNRINWMYRSTDGGATWTSVQIGTGQIGPGSTVCGYFCAVPPIWRHMGWGQPAVGPAGTVHYDYAARNGAADQDDIYYIRSTDNGLTWSTPVILNQDTSSYAQWMPSLVATASGQVIASWYDRRNSAGGQSYQRYGRISNNAGATWQNDDVISDVVSPQPLQPDGSIQACYCGDYDYNSANGTTALLEWADGRVLISGNSQQDIFFDKVQLCATVPNAPTTTTATASAPNQITVTWNSVAGANCYNVYKSSGACPGSTFVIVSTCQAGTTYVDNTVSGGLTYSYKVTSVITPSMCESVFGPCANATATGVCLLSPNFAGATAAVDNKGTSCSLTLQWVAGTSSCPTYPTLTYTIYKSTDPAFVPGPANQVATCVSSTTWNDTNVNYGTTYYYVVRAEDSRPGGGSGPCNGGNIETNVVKKSGTPTGPPVIGNINWPFETDLNGWTVTGTWALSTARVNPGGSTHSVHSSQALNLQCDYFLSPVIQPSGSSTLTIPNWYDTEINNGTYWYDRCNVWAVQGATKTLLTPTSGKLYSTGTYYSWSYCTMGTSPGWCGAGTSQAWGNSVFDLSAYNGQNIQIEVRYMTDDLTVGEGVYVDDISATNIQTPTACTTGGQSPGKLLNTLKATKTSGNPVLCWTAVGGTCTVTGYEVYRGNLPWTVYNHASLSCSASSCYTDAAAPGSYYYLVVSYNTSSEGSYGTQFPAGTERPQGSSPCKTQSLTVCN